MNNISGLFVLKLQFGFDYGLMVLRVLNNYFLKFQKIDFNTNDQPNAFKDWGVVMINEESKLK